MKTLCLGWFWYTPDDLLRQVAEEESLETVQFSGCSLLTDATIERILAKCCHLKMLGLAFNDNDNLTPSILDTYAKCGRKCFVQIKKCQAFDAGALAEKVSNLYRVEIDRDS